MQTPTSNCEVSIEIPNVSTKDIEVDKDKTTVVTVEEEPTSTVSKNDRQRKYWVMFGGAKPQNPPPAPNQSWFPWSYLPGYNPPPPQKPPPLSYKPETRNSFVKLVMSIVLIMILLTALFIGYVLMTPDVKDFFMETGWSLLIPALALLMIADYGFMCSPCSRQMPCNIVFLFLGMTAMSIISAKITAHYETEVVLYAILATAAAVSVCVLLACSNFDFTKYLLYVVMIATGISVVFMIVVLVKVITGAMMKPIIIGILVVATVMECIFLTMQLQMILGGRTVEISESDYALAAFLVYTSIVDIFIKMVQIIGLSDM